MQQPPISDGGYTILLVTSHHISCCIHASSTLHHHYWRSHAFALILCNETGRWRNTTIREIVLTTTCAPQGQSGEWNTTRHVLRDYNICRLVSEMLKGDSVMKQTFTILLLLSFLFTFLDLISWSYLSTCLSNLFSLWSLIGTLM